MTRDTEESTARRDEVAVDSRGPLFSVCIPNFNYGRYLQRTIGSVLSQSVQDFDIHVADNASTDDSVGVIRGLGDARVHLRVNACNVGFAANLDRAAAPARGRHLLMLSSDDVMRPSALDVYARLLGALPTGQARRVVLTSSVQWIDSDDQDLGLPHGMDRNLWRDATIDADMSSIAGCPVYSVSAQLLLRQSLLLVRNPLPFLATCYPRELYDLVEGYGAGRFIGPDKWFAWKILARAERALFIDRPLFGYRWHTANQSAQQAQSGALKHSIDQYANTFDAPADLLATAGVTREQLVRAFVEQDVALRNLDRVADGKRRLAKRGLRFGEAAYPEECNRSWKVWALRTLLMAGPLGTPMARAAKRLVLKYGAERVGAPRPASLRAG